MRELTSVEMELVAGGNFLESEPERAPTWWENAFNSLEDGLSAIALFFSGFTGNYIDSFGPAIDRARETGGLIDGREDAYNRYMYEATGDESYNTGGGG